MRKGQTADQIRIYAAIRSGGAPTRQKAAPSTGRVSARLAPTQPVKNRDAAEQEEAIMQGRERLEALDDARLRRQRALAERQEIENMLRRGELLPVAHVRGWVARLLIEAREELLRLPNELADGLAAETDAVKIAAILRSVQERAITNLYERDKLWLPPLEG
jgi:hypothetical protein